MRTLKQAAEVLDFLGESKVVHGETMTIEVKRDFAIREVAGSYHLFLKDSSGWYKSTGYDECDSFDDVLNQAREQVRENLK